MPAWSCWMFPSAPENHPDRSRAVSALATNSGNTVLRAAARQPVRTLRRFVAYKTVRARHLAGCPLEVDEFAGRVENDCPLFHLISNFPERRDEPQRVSCQAISSFGTGRCRFFLSPQFHETSQGAVRTRAKIAETCTARNRDVIGIRRGKTTSERRPWLL